MNITKVKFRKTGYLVNDEMSVPNNPDNAQYKEIQEWIANGGIVEPEYTLPEGKAKKLAELDEFHYNSSLIRQCTINNYFILSLTTDGRTLISEQIGNLVQKIKLGLITEEDAEFEYFFNGGSVTITLLQLRNLYVSMINIVNSNYQNYKEEINIIKNLPDLESVESHDFTLNYLKNQNIDIV